MGGVDEDDNHGSFNTCVKQARSQHSLLFSRSALERHAMVSSALGSGTHGSQSPNHLSFDKEFPCTTRCLCPSALSLSPSPFCPSPFPLLHLHLLLHPNIFRRGPTSLQFCHHCTRKVTISSCLRKAHTCPKQCHSWSGCRPPPHANIERLQHPPK